MYEKVSVALAVLSAKLLEQKVPAIEPPPVCVCSCHCEPRSEEPKIVDCVEVDPSWDTWDGARLLCALAVGQFSVLIFWFLCGRRRRPVPSSEVTKRSPQRRGAGFWMEIGTKAVVWYSDDTVWHERLILLPGSAPGLYWVWTPDGDIYEEDLQGKAKEG